MVEYCNYLIILVKISKRIKEISNGTYCKKSTLARNKRDRYLKKIIPVGVLANVIYLLLNCQPGKKNLYIQPKFPISLQCLYLLKRYHTLKFSTIIYVLIQCVESTTHQALKEQAEQLELFLINI